jgi:hypothetical protein
MHAYDQIAAEPDELKDTDMEPLMQMPDLSEAQDDEVVM